jgi:hypothetical protein
VRSATGAHNQELVGAPDQGAGSGGPPETKSLAVGRPLGSIQQEVLNDSLESISESFVSNAEMQKVLATAHHSRLLRTGTASSMSNCFIFFLLVLLCCA